MEITKMVIIGWEIGFAIYSIIRKVSPRKNVEFYNVKNKVKKYKSIEHEMSKSISQQGKFF
jgi:hypothetical protein